MEQFNYGQRKLDELWPDRREPDRETETEKERVIAEKIKSAEWHRSQARAAAKRKAKSRA
jgi:hypothetical protein